MSVPVVSCSGYTCTFDGSGSTDDNGIVTYEWRPAGPSVISTEAVWSMTFTAGRTRTWTLTVIDGTGQSDVESVTFTVPAP